MKKIKIRKKLNEYYHAFRDSRSIRYIETSLKRFYVKLRKVPSFCKKKLILAWDYVYSFFVVKKVYFTYISMPNWVEGEGVFTTYRRAFNHIYEYVKEKICKREEFDKENPYPTSDHWGLYQMVIKKQYVNSEKEDDIVFKMSIQKFNKEQFQ